MFCYLTSEWSMQRDNNTDIPVHITLLIMFTPERNLQLEMCPLDIDHRDLEL